MAMSFVSSSQKRLQNCGEHARTSQEWTMTSCPEAYATTTARGSWTRSLGRSLLSSTHVTYLTTCGLEGHPISGVSMDTRIQSALRPEISCMCCLSCCLVCAAHVVCCLSCLHCSHQENCWWGHCKEPLQPLVILLLRSCAHAYIVCPPPPPPLYNLLSFSMLFLCTYFWFLQMFESFLTPTSTLYFLMLSWYALHVS